MKRRRVVRWVQDVAAFLLAILVLAGCQTATPTVQDTPLATILPLPSATPGEPPTATPAPLGDTPAPESPTPEIRLTDAQQVVALAVADLSQQLSVPEESILVKSVEAVQWSDASVGCPKPGMLYAQVVTPGYLVILGMEEQTYEYHTDQDQLVVLCADLPLPRENAPGESQLPIFVEMVQEPLSPDSSSRMPPEDANPVGVYVFNPGDRSLLVAPAIQILPTTEVLVGLSGATVPGKPYILSDLFQVPSAQTSPLRVIAVDADSGTVTLSYADQTFELEPGQSKSFKEGGEEESAILQMTTITNHGRLEAIDSLPPDSGSP
jgi:hypothetical protein